MSRVLAFALSAALAAAALPASAEQMMTRFSGDWVGTGQVLLGGQYGAMFRCELKGDPARQADRFDLTGRCWMGSISAPVFAQLRYNDATHEYYGEFMDGADGMGADIVGARAGEALSLKLMRGSMQGRLTAAKVGAEQMKVMLYYRDPQTSKELLAAAMGFARPDANSLPNYMPSFSTGSITPGN